MEHVPPRPRLLRLWRRAEGHKRKPIARESNVPAHSHRQINFDWLIDSLTKSYQSGDQRRVPTCPAFVLTAELISICVIIYITPPPLGASSRAVTSSRSTVVWRNAREHYNSE